MTKNGDNMSGADGTILRLRADLEVAENEIKQLQVGLSSRTVIGQAEGIVMERLQVTGEQAFEYLRRVSSLNNRKIVDLAIEIVSTRKLPDLD